MVVLAAFTFAATSFATLAQAPAPQPPPASTQADPSKSEEVVWVNTDSGTYHKKGSRWYGKTKHGKYMTEADAIKAGYKPAK
jgi:hypothetical protein